MLIERCHTSRLFTVFWCFKVWQKCSLIFISCHKGSFTINVRADILMRGGRGVLRFSKNGRTLITFHNPLRNCKRTFFSGAHETESRDDDFLQWNLRESFPHQSSLWDVIKFHKTSHNVVLQRESRFRVSKRLAPFNVAVEHLSVFQDERTELIYVPKNTGKFGKYRTCEAVNPGKKGPAIVECLKEWVKSEFVEEWESDAWRERCKDCFLLSSIYANLLGHVCETCSLHYSK